MMNLKKLFVVGSVLVMAWTTANAELVNGVRQKPEPATTQSWVLSSDTTQNFYLYNPGAKAFFTEGNAWGTQASVGVQGLKVAFTVPTAADVPGTVALEDLPQGVYLLNDFSVKKGSWKLVFFDSETAMFVDRGSQADFGWGVTPIEGTNNFRIHVSATSEISPTYNLDSYSGKFVGLDVTSNASNTALNPFLEEGEGHYIDWTFVTSDVYEAYLQAIEIYNKAQILKAILDDAKAHGVNVSAQEAVYQNEAATMEELDAAIDAAKAAIVLNATVDSPVDMTTSLTNPGFADGKKTGWNGTDPAFGEGAAEFYQKNYDIYQTLKGLPNGVYGVSVQAFYRTSWADVSYKDWQNKTAVAAKVYAKSGADSLNTALFNAWEFAVEGDINNFTPNGAWKGSVLGERNVANDPPLYIPDDMKAASYLFSLDANNYKQTAYVAVDNGELTVGLKKSDDNPGGNWTLFDNFTLSYFGTAPEAYQMALEKGMPAKTEYSTANVSKQYIDAYDAAYTATATDKATFSAAVKAVADANDSIAKNTKLWADLQAKRDEAYALSVNTDYKIYDHAWYIGDYLEAGTDENDEQVLPMGVNDYLKAEAKTGDYDLSNKQLEDIIATLNSLIEALNNEVKEGLKPGTDVTKFLTNPDFEDGKNGWTVVNNGGGNVAHGGNNDNHCFEAWHSTNFDVYQEVSNLPVGLYKLEVNGFVRYLDGDDAISKASEAPEDPGIYLYMNDSKTNLVNMMTCPLPKTFYDAVNGATYLTQNEENCFPNNMIAASAAFAAGNYLQETVCMVAEPNTVTRIGVKGTPEAKFWPIFDNFKLTYLGNGVDIVKPQLEDMLAEAKKNESVVTTKTAKTALTNEIAAAEALLAGEDGDAMLEAIDKLQKAINDVTDGKAVCEKFAEFIEDYMQFAQSIDATEALQLGATILGNLNACAYDAEDIEAKKLELREMRLKIQLPADYAQGSAQGADLTAFIQTPDFSMIKDGVETNSNEGWLGTAGSFGPSDQMSNLCLEFYNKVFDMYQDLAGVGSVVLPHGYYSLQVNAFNRPAESNPAYLYAVAGKDTLDVKTIMLQSEGFDAEGGESAPNNVSSAKACFDEGRYLNTLKFKFEGDTLRIGVKHPVNAGTDWVIMDNFRLFFYGNDNTGVETVINIGKPAKVQYFTLDGRQVNVARKGLFIRKTTMDNGTVVVRKIQK